MLFLIKFKNNWFFYTITSTSTLCILIFLLVAGYNYKQKWFYPLIKILKNPPIKELNSDIDPEKFVKTKHLEELTNLLTNKSTGYKLIGIYGGGKTSVLKEFC